MVRMEINVASNEIYHSEQYTAWLRNAGEEYKEYRRQWVENPKNNVVSTFPLHVSFESTNACNLECVFCSRTIKKKEGLLKPTKAMSMGLFKKVIDEGVEKGLKAVKLNTGDTEPLLVKNLSERISYAKKAGVLEVMFNTNAALLSEEKAMEILNSGLDKILISFDSPEKEKYEKVRVGANYDEVLENIFRFCKMKKEMNLKKPFVSVQMVLMKDTYKYKDKFIKMFEDHADIIRVGNYYNRQELNTNNLCVNKKIQNEEFACSQLWQRLHVRVDGTVIPCCGDVTNKLSLGNAIDSHIEHLWKCDKLNEYRRLHLEGQWMKIEACRMCGIAYA